MVVGCAESKEYYKRFESYIGHEYKICKNLLVRERKGKKRLFLIIVDESKKVDLRKLKEEYLLSKLEFVDEDTMFDLIKTRPGNVSVFNIIDDYQKRINIIIDEELTDSLLAFHPLCSSLSIFLEFKEIEKFLSIVNREYKIDLIPCMEYPNKEKVLVL